VGCARSSQEGGKVTLLLAGYSAAREAFGEVIPAFQKHWYEKTGQNVVVKQSYSSSGAQSRAIAAGFPADVAALAVAGDIDRLVKEGLVQPDWKDQYGGMVTRSVVIFAVREGNPHGIKEWEDLAQKEIELLMPNPKTSGGAQWNILSAYGAALHGKVPGYPQNKKGGKAFLVDLLSKVTVMDKGARESIINFEFGAGDVAVTYESEALIGRAHGEKYEVVIPRSSVIVENPVAVVSANAKKHGVEEIAQGFVQFLYSEQAQRIFARSGFRPVNKVISQEVKNKFPPIADYWSVSSFGNWEKIMKNFFGPKGTYTLAIKEVRGLKK